MELGILWVIGFCAASYFLGKYEEKLVKAYQFLKSDGKKEGGQ